MIHEENEYVKMMATNLLGPQVDIRELEQRIATKSMMSQAKSKVIKDSTEEKVKIERVTAYKKGPILIFNIFKN